MLPQSRAVRAAALIFTISLVIGVLVSGISAPAFWELPRLRAVSRGAELVWNVAEYGPSVFRSSSARAIYDEVQPFGVLPVIASGWAQLSLGHFGVLDGLTAQRFAFIVLVSTVPASLFLMVERAWGALVAWLATLLLFAQPRWLHETGLASDAAVTTAGWFLVLAAYVRSLPDGTANPKATRCWAVATGVAFAFGVALSFSVLWVLPCLLLHYWLLHTERFRRLLRRGKVPAPAALLWALAALPIFILALVPQLWEGGARSAAAWLLSAVRPDVEPTLFLGETVEGHAVPRSFAAVFIPATVPLVVLALAFVGAWSHLRGSRPAADSLAATGPRLGLLTALFVLGGLIAIVATPPLLTRFPPRSVAVLPFVSAFAALGVVRISERSSAARWKRGVYFGLPIGCVVLATFGLPSSGAAFSWLVGGAPTVLRTQMFTVGDGAELSELVRAIDALGQSSLALHSPDTPAGYWEGVHRVGRVRTQVVERPNADWVLVRGEAADARFVVTRTGATLWSLSGP